MPSVNSSSVPAVLDSSTVMTPSLPTLSNASAMRSPISAVLRGDGRDVRDLGLAVDLARASRRSSALTRLDRGVDAALELHRGGAGRDVAQALVDHRLGEHGRGGGAVTGDVVGLGGDLLGELRAEVLVRVVELDLAGDRHAVVGDRGGAELLVDDDVAALRAERHLHRVGERVDAALEAAAGVLVELQGLGHEVGWSSPSRTAPATRGSRWRATPPAARRWGTAAGAARALPSGSRFEPEAQPPTTASRSRAERMRYSSPSYLTSVPPYLL